MTDHDSQGLVDAPECLKLVFPSEESRPSLRTFRRWQKKRFFPVIKVGRMTFFDAEEVRAALQKRFTIWDDMSGPK